MAEIQEQAPVHVQDEAVLRTMLGLGERKEIPEAILEAYYVIRRLKHRVLGGPLSVDAMLLVIHTSKGEDLVPEPEAKEAGPPGRALDSSEGQVQPDVALVGGSEMFIKHKGDWCLAKYEGLGKGGKFRFALDGKTVYVADRADMRFKE